MMTPPNDPNQILTAIGVMTSIMNLDDHGSALWNGTVPDDADPAALTRHNLDAMNTVMDNDAATGAALIHLVQALLRLRQDEAQRTPRETLQELGEGAVRALNARNQ